MFAPDAGDATIFGHSVLRDMDKVREIIGVCPQHDLLWNDLTVLEHVRLFAGLKGIDDRDPKTQAAIDTALAEVDLTSKAGALTGTLSGGMKRRLSVAMAFIISVSTSISQFCCCLTPYPRNPHSIHFLSSPPRRPHSGVFGRTHSRIRSPGAQKHVGLAQQHVGLAQQQKGRACNCPDHSPYGRG